MKLQRTLSIIKPDATERNITGQVNAMLEGAGLRIVAQKRVVLTQAQAEGFYAEHAARPFFSELVEFMVSGPVVLQVLEGQNAVQRNRDIMGATNPKEAEKGTIRAEHGRSLGENSVHGSDSTKSAEREIAYFFDADSIPG